MLYAVLIIVIVVLVILVAILMVRPLLRRRRLRGKFGDEYDRVVDTTDDRRSAERELAQRERRHSGFDIRELSAEEKDRYTTRWTLLQEQFIDEPAETVTASDQLVTTLMAERGYPTEGYEQQIADLSVEHSTTLGHYRAAHDIVTRPGDTQISTEDRRTAMLHYRELFQDLLDGDTHSKHNEKDLTS